MGGGCESQTFKDRLKNIAFYIQTQLLEQLCMKRQIGFDFFLGKTESELTLPLPLEMI